MAAALQLIPAGARSMGGGVYQLPRRRGAGRAVAKGKSKKASHKVGFFSRQWVWYALALVIADAIGDMILPDTAKWISIPAVGLYAYGKAKNKPGACNAALAIQGAHLLAYFGVGEMIKGAAVRVMGR